ncbi:FAD/NAD(P)-binding protein [Salinigranum marinum]|uniref:FAD/NAD(P)-binding protein n=1 Tax=Salinigranum marinum TaxID=1515595 RepID=UPI002989BC29|nr:FAD/NAD(P)-binding protein [Salinigranum marinum]
MSTDTRRPDEPAVPGRPAEDSPGRGTLDRRPSECVIVGGGLHGIHVAAKLLEETEIDHGQLRIVDLNHRLATNFRAKATQCGMESMRSSSLDHVGVHPLELELFAARRNRTDELFETDDYPPRPSLSLFLDHVDHVVDRYDLDDLHVRARVTALRESDDRVVVETDEGTLDAHRCVLAIGHGNRYTRPSWTTALDGSAVDHVWDRSFDLDHWGRVVVVGGGVTAAQTALSLSERGADVTLLARSGLTERTIEADQRWQRWNHIEQTLHGHPPGHRARLRRISRARYDGTVPSYLLRDIEAAVAENELSVVDGDVLRARDDHESGVRLAVTDGRCLRADHIALATGFESPFDHPFVERVAAAEELVRGEAGMPVLDDRTLAWTRPDGVSSSIHVVGALAMGSVGPFAGNVIGARLAAAQLVDALSLRESGSSAVAVEQPAGF